MKIFKGRHLIFVLALALMILSAVFSVIVASGQYKEVENLKKAAVLNAIDQRLQTTFTAMNDFPGSAGKDLLFLKTLTNENDLRDFIQNSKVYKELIGLRADGICEFQFNNSKNLNSDGNCALPLSVQKISGKAKLLDQKEIYISPLESYKNSPVIFYAALRNGGGTLISVIEANYFLEEIRRLSRPDELVYLLESDGSYLANPNRAREKLFNPSGGQAGSNANFYRDFTAIPANILTDAAVDRFETDKSVFTFWRIYPTESNFAFYNSSNKVSGPDHGSRYFWVMAAVSAKPAEKLFWQDPANIGTIAALIILHFLVIMIFYLFVVYGKQ